MSTSKKAKKNPQPDMRILSEPLAPQYPDPESDPNCTCIKPQTMTVPCDICKETVTMAADYDYCYYNCPVHKNEVRFSCGRNQRVCETCLAKGLNMVKGFGESSYITDARHPGSRFKAMKDSNGNIVSYKKFRKDKTNPDSDWTSVGNITREELLGTEPTRPSAPSIPSESDQVSPHDSGEDNASISDDLSPHDSGEDYASD